MIYAAVAVAGDIVNLPLDSVARPVHYVALLAVAALTPAIVLATESGGIRNGLDPLVVLTSARRHPGTTLGAGALTLLLGVIANLGLILFGFGVLLTAAYSIPAWAAVIHRYEKASA